MLKKALITCLALLLLFSCSRTEPRIPFGFIEMVYYPGETRPVERFSFFVIAEDDDGMDNLDELRLYHDRDGLEWIINSQDWVHHEEDGRHWIGSRAIAMTGDRTLPRGQYRAVLFNKGGEKTERSFTFDAPEYQRLPYPSFRLEGGNYSIDSRYPLNSFIVYDQQGNVLRTIPVSNTEGSTADLNLPNGARLLALWARDEAYRTSALTEAISLR
ncbi:MAG: hypothetical protein LBI14_11575 [Treponema sp.]|jgi:hypothetical protein|nr:hypothetical protein [Treponema sp.]